MFFAGSFATIRRRRLASPTSILEIEATHPLVEVAGVEPASPELLVGLLRAQPLEDVTHRQVNGILSAGQPRFYVPMGPEALPIGEPSWMTPRADE